MPPTEVARHYREVHAVFEELIHRPWGTACWSPATDVWETDDAFLFEMDLPGVETEAICVTAEGHTLSIEGHRDVAHSERDHQPHRCERPEGRFRRTFQFEQRLDPEQIEHRANRGVLVVTVRKSRTTSLEQDRDHAEP
jgi:HSP20 family protein